MAATENKVQFNLKKVHYAVMNTGGSTPTWATPVPVPGAVNLSLKAQGKLNKFYADGMVYYQSSSNAGYEGDLEMARFIDKMLQDGDAGNDLYCLYNCTGTRPGIAAATSTETKEPQTQTSTISAAPLENGYVFARTTAETSEDVRNAWFTKVWEKTGVGA